MMIKKIYDYIEDILRADREVSRINENREWNNQVTITWIAIIGSLVMSFLNVSQHSRVMLCFTMGSVVFLLLGYLVGKRKHWTKLLKFSFTLLFVFAFTMYTLMGGNDGFASLWLILAPYVLIVIIDLQVGFWACVYYLLMLFLCFKGPLSFLVQYQYSKMFLTRFPVLYAINFAFALSFAIRMRRYQFELLQGKEELERLSIMDISTGLGNRNGYNLFIKRMGVSSQLEKMSAVYIDVNGLHEMNNLQGHEAGDRMLCEIASLCQKKFTQEKIFRIGGDEFLILSDRLKRKEVEKIMIDMCKEIEKMKYSIAYGIAYGQTGMDIDELVREADHRMLENKRLYYSMNEYSGRKCR